ncbi:MAG: hypothetical protein BWX81_01835 [Spirochaetes bacterium ADurb.Bin110]|nr:MAG: hypothetical protein BWX81_01835 [Spirochaetes bacterium ADurb.Bin110]
MRRGIKGISVRNAMLVTAIMILLASIPCANAQTTGKKSVSIQIVVYVPAILNLTLDFSASGVAELVAYLGDPPDLRGKGFELKSNSIVSLGAAHVTSNLSSGYSIVVQSMNGCALKNQDSEGTVKYDLLLGGIPAERQGDSFKLNCCGTTPFEGRVLPVSIALGNVPSNAAPGLYADNLLFNIMTN